MSLIYKKEDVNRFENNMLICLNYTPVLYCVENSTEVEERWTVLLFMVVTCICQPFDYHNTVIHKSERIQIYECLTHLTLLLVHDVIGFLGFLLFTNLL